LEERRTQAVVSRRTLDPALSNEIGALDPAAVERVRREAWPQPESAEDLHDALTWMGFITDGEGAAWSKWLLQSANRKRVVHRDGKWFAVDGLAEARELILGRLEALGPVAESDERIALAGDPKQLLLELEREGAILRTRLDGRCMWCERRLLARIHRYTLET